MVEGSGWTFSLEACCTTTSSACSHAHIIRRMELVPSALPSGQLRDLRRAKLPGIVLGLSLELLGGEGMSFHLNGTVILGQL